MGRFACELIESEAGFELCARVTRGESLSEFARASGAQVGLELTCAGLGFRHGQSLLDAGVSVVIGTSGVDRIQTKELDAKARGLGLGVVVVPNFSLGMLCLQRAARTIAREFQRAEILEQHHDKKKDAPSSTAVRTQELLQEEGHADVPIHSVRLPGLYAHQTLYFGSPGETLSLRHDMLGPEAFGPGILMALEHAATSKGVSFGLEAVLTRESDKE